MKTRDWLVILGCAAAPLLACSSTDDDTNTPRTTLDAGKDSTTNKTDSSTVVDSGGQTTDPTTDAGGGATEVDSAADVEKTTDAAGDGALPEDGDPAACNACMQSTCATAIEDCKAETNCNKFLGCYSKCADQDCIGQCMEANPAAKPLWNKFEGYYMAKCHDECFGTGCLFGTKECNPCLSSQCATECHVADKNVDVMTYVACRQFCADGDAGAACETECEDAYGAAATPPFEALDKCAGTTCKAECS